MRCPYFDEGDIGRCSLSVPRHVPSIDTMETYCFKPTFRLCPVLADYLDEKDMAIAGSSTKKKVSCR